MTEYTYEEFQKRIEHWSFTHQVEFLMQGNWWCDEIIAFIEKKWKEQDDDFSEEDVDTWELLNVKAEPQVPKRIYDQLYKMYNNLLNLQLKE